MLSDRNFKPLIAVISDKNKWPTLGINSPLLSLLDMVESRIERIERYYNIFIVHEIIFYVE